MLAVRLGSHHLITCWIVRSTRSCSTSALTLNYGRLVSESTRQSQHESRLDRVIENPIDSFSGFALLPEVQLSILNSGIVVPTSAQIQSIPRLLNGENVLLISQTGKGKTLAYLIPIVDKLIRSNQDQLFPKPHRPRAIVVVPTRELVIQTLSVIRKVFGSSVSSLGLAPDLLSFVKEKRILSTLGADLLVTTPSRLELHLKRGPNGGGICLSAVQSFVFDEADTLCDSTYESGVRSLISQLMKRGSGCQFTIVGATRTAAVNAFVTSIPGLVMKPVLTEDAHTLVPQLDQVFVPVGRRKRTSCLLEVLASDKTIPNSKTLVFTNSVRTCNFVSKFLRETEAVTATSLHGEMPPKVRSANYKKFADPKSGCDVLVCTNLASRGVDLDSVNHVIMYDFPHTLADYIHRAGRTGRAGRLGKVTALYTKRNLVLARQIEQAARLGKPIEYAKPKHDTASPRRAVKLEKYRAALDDLKSAPRGAKTQRLRALRSSLGLPPNIRLGSPAKRLSARAWKEGEKKKETLEFLKKRKRVDKRVDKLPDLPNRVHAASETRTQSRIVRNSQSGDLQMVSSRR